jgi:hypothetical protein
MEPQFKISPALPSDKTATSGKILAAAKIAQKIISTNEFFIIVIIG